MTEFKHGIAGFAGEDEVVQSQVTGQLQLRYRPGLHEMQVQIAAEPPLGHGQWQRQGDVGQIARQLQLVELEVHYRFAGIREGSGVTVDAQRAAVHAQRQQRLHEHVGVAGQVGDEGDAQLQLLDVVAGLGHPIVELDVACVHADVGQREARR